ncbi:hypothetical protein CEC48_01905 [Pseudomonas sp. K2I15]|nr:hypothetical protein CEC48_01905 [Pseudomonas sp. K2I15]
MHPPVGAGLLAKALGQSTHVLTDTPLSRASPTFDLHSFQETSPLGAISRHIGRDRALAAVAPSRVRDQTGLIGAHPALS